MPYSLTLHYWHQRCDSSLPTTNRSNFQFSDTLKFQVRDLRTLPAYFEAKGYKFDLSGQTAVGFHTESDTLVEFVYEWESSITPAEIFTLVNDHISTQKAELKYWKDARSRWQTSELLEYSDYIH